MLEPTTRDWTTTALAVATVLSLALTGPATAQDGGSDQVSVELGGLLRTGLVAGPGDRGVRDGFELFDVRTRASGEVGIVFDYHVEAEYDDAREELRLLDARLTLPIMPELAVDLGQFRAPFGKEALEGKGDITFVERAQVSRLLPPGRQVGAQLSGETLEGRLTYRAGLFNGNGRTFSNDDDELLWAGRVQFNNLGASEFYDELVVEVGANAAFSEDSAADLASRLEGPVTLAGEVDPASFDGDRLLYGGDLRLGYRGFFMRGEYLRGELEPAGGLRFGDVISDDELVVEGGYLEGGYSYLGAIEAVVRYDAISDEVVALDGRRTTDPDEPPSSAEFLVFGLNLYPGYHAKVGLQYAVGIDGTRLGPGLADGEFALMAQVDF